MERACSQVDEHVGESVFDSLERADVPTELHSRLGVIDGQVEQVLGSADLFDGQRADPTHSARAIARMSRQARQPGERRRPGSEPLPAGA